MAILVTAHLQTKSEEARNKLLHLFADITEHAYKHEKTGTTRYITAIPLDQSNKTSIYMIEQYADKAGQDAHMGSAAVKALLDAFAKDEPITGPPELHVLDTTIDYKRSGKNLVEPGNLLILAHIGYKPGQSASAIPLLKDLIGTISNTEPEFYSCTACEDKSANTVRVVDVFQSDEFYENVHAKSEAIAKFHTSNTPLATGEFGFVKCRIVQGYLNVE